MMLLYSQVRLALALMLALTCPAPANAAGLNDLPGLFRSTGPAPRPGSAIERDAMIVSPGARPAGLEHPPPNPGPLVPGTEAVITIGATCVPGRANANGCHGTTTYSFDPRWVEIRNVQSEGAACARTATGAQEVSCLVAEEAGRSHVVRVGINIDPDARGVLGVGLRAQGDYQAEPPEFQIPFKPEATVDVRQSPNPSPVLNGSEIPVIETRLLLRNRGPSSIQGTELTETFGAAPWMTFKIAEDSREFCISQERSGLFCHLGHLAPGERRSIKFSAFLPTEVPTSGSSATVTVKGDVEPIRTSTFAFVHIGRDYTGYFEIPDEVQVNHTFDVGVHFVNLGEQGAGNGAIPFEWIVDLGPDVQLVSFTPHSPLLSCARGPGLQALRCVTPDITAIGSSGDATLHVLTSKEGDRTVTLTWDGGLWRIGESRGVIRASSS